jgi:pimeloyl-ACP methyl ester carboxylesterase
MASLTHSHRVKAAAMVVGVNDNVWSSGYCTWRKPSTTFEGIFNSLPLFLTGPLNSLALHAGNFYLMRLGGFESQLTDILPLEAKPSLQTWLKGGAKNVGLGASLDCQQGLLYATSTKTNYTKITQPVSSWYGLQDSTVPMKTAEWLEEQLQNARLYKLDGGHGLYFTHMEHILDDSVFQMDKADEKAKEAS